MALSHPITIFAPQKYYIFPTPTNHFAKIFQNKKEQALKFIEKSLNFSA